ncbi:TIGR03086 family metal-binding protein [Actinospica sp.]|uniref:TIGR03086 family metal-binding protein n=1 Tax=Actinospica sp. TaxID=1872142 RepID=UPI002D7F479D|nr:TIGR03086 family metal-binding protein [Actinospica sp.]
MELLVLNRRATLRCVELVCQARPEDLTRRTPCAAWDLGDLLAHMTVQHRGFAAAAAGNGAEFDWAPYGVGADYAEQYAAAAGEALRAFDEPGALDRPFALPEIPAAPSFSGAQAVRFHFIDAVVHGWDVARSLGLDYELPGDFAESAVGIALAVPGGAYRERPGAAFGPVRGSAGSAAGAASSLEVVLRALGRSPKWPDGTDES